MTNEIEEPIDPGIRIVDAHHHLFDRPNPVVGRVMRRQRFLIDDYTELVSSGHNVVATVVVESQTMYRGDGPEELRTVGQTEFFDGQGAMGASGSYDKVKVAAGIVGQADLRFSNARATLEAHLEAAPHRFKGIRQEALWDEDASILVGVFDNGPGMYLDQDFRRGFAHLAPLGLTFDAFVLAPQLPDIVDLARAFPETSIVLDHLGHPLEVGRHAARMEEERPQWESDMRAIAACENVTVKMGGLGSFMSGSSTFLANPPATSEQLAAEWRPYVETTVELFGADRTMFESNLPTDGSGPFAHVCNAYQRLTAQCSQTEREAIFAGTATRVYGLEDVVLHV
ncbi:amidohydrolase family protein [Rhodococcoides kyotonense]|uniref:Predicted metal-dependent hydrolase, TIM-barrel fold n=1 Tax=Rhodococcoides kyotonense TaxID=398843 RepID=A0A239HMS4_9NOCA|nr:amidohydrolase family protein [Rhodococcus kyotonensis]SNS82689.1 Predicted metal-dependent hydrolase, TIM-barrel fold [Rhodococcus kyotonensis]